MTAVRRPRAGSHLLWATLIALPLLACGTAAPGEGMTGAGAEASADKQDGSNATPPQGTRDASDPLRPVVVVTKAPDSPQAPDQDDADAIKVKFETEGAVSHALTRAWGAALTESQPQGRLNAAAVSALLFQGLNQALPMVINLKDKLGTVLHLSIRVGAKSDKDVRALSETLKARAQTLSSVSLALDTTGVNLDLANEKTVAALLKNWSDTAQAARAAFPQARLLATPLWWEDEGSLEGQLADRINARIALQAPHDGIALSVPRTRLTGAELNMAMNNVASAFSGASTHHVQWSLPTDATPATVAARVCDLLVADAGGSSLFSDALVKETGDGSEAPDAVAPLKKVFAELGGVLEGADAVLKTFALDDAPGVSHVVVRKQDGTRALVVANTTDSKVRFELVVSKTSTAEGSVEESRDADVRKKPSKAKTTESVTVRVPPRSYSVIPLG